MDLIARMDGASHPPVTGLVVRIGGRDLFVPIDKTTGLGTGRVVFSGNEVDLRRFERRPGELLLGRDLSTHHLINVVTGGLIRANEIELACVSGRWEVMGVDPTRRPLVLRHFRRRRGSPKTVVDWTSIEPFVAHVPSARLRIPYRKLARLHPAQIADLVEAASHEEGEEIIQAVHGDRELEADVFEELDTGHQLEFLQSRSDVEAARLLSSMAPDDAADLIVEVEQDRRLPILDLMPPPQRQKLRSLLSYHPETAGGLMIPDFACVDSSSKVEQALAAVRASEAPPEALAVVFVLDDDGLFKGAVSVVELVKAAPASPVGALAAESRAAHVHPEWDLGATVRKMSDFNLTVAPVLDHEHRELLGVVTIDDVVELLLPTGFRRDYGLTAREE